MNKAKLQLKTEGRDLSQNWKISLNFKEVPVLLEQCRKDETANVTVNYAYG